MRSRYPLTLLRGQEAMTKNRNFGIFCAVLAAVLYGIAPLLAKIAYFGGSNAITLTMFRSLLSFPVLYFVIRVKGLSLKVTTKEFYILIVLSFLGAFATGLMLYDSYNYISIGLATCIHFVYPVLVTVACVLFFRDRLSRTKLLALILAVAGLWMMLDGDVILNLTGVGFAFSSGIAYAAYLILMDKSGIKHLHALVLCFYCCIIASVYLFAFGAITHQLTFDLTPSAWVVTFLMAMIVSVVANSVIMLAVQHVGPTVASILGMFEPIVSVILGILFLHEVCTLRSLLACGLVIVAVTLLTMEKEPEDKREKRNGEAVKLPGYDSEISEQDGFASDMENTKDTTE